MLLMTTWKVRSITPEASKRMMAVWSRQLELNAKDPVWKELWVYFYTDGSGGVNLIETPNTEVAAQRGLQIAMELTEFLEMETKPVLSLEQAMPAIVAWQATMVS
jgi:hypothetical protein